MTVGQRLKMLRKDRRYTQIEAGDLINLTQQSWALMEKDKRKLTGEEAKILAKEFDTNVHWLITGEGHMTGKQDKDEIKKIPLVPFAELANLDDSYAPTEMNYSGALALPNLENPENYIATVVSGRSMEPDIREGSIIVLQQMQSRSEFMDERVYVVIIQDIPFLRRVDLILSGENKGRFRFSSDNGEMVKFVEEKDITKWFRLECVVNWVR